MEQSDKEFKEDFRQRLRKWCWDTNSVGAEKIMEERLMDEFFKKLDKHQKRQVKMLCEIFAHKPSTDC